MLFIVSVAMTSIVGYFLAFKWRALLSLTEKVFLSIFTGWGYFTSLMMFFSRNVPSIKLNQTVLMTLLFVSLLPIVAFCIIKPRKNLAAIKQALNSWKVKRPKFSSLWKYYLIIPALFLILLLAGITIDAILYDINDVDPIFQWDQRAELIYLEGSVSGATKHLFGTYPLHTPLLHAWGYFFGFKVPKFFYCIALFGLIAILFQAIRRQAQSSYPALLFCSFIVAAQAYYTKTAYAEGISNIYFVLGVVYAVRYFLKKHSFFLLLASI